jgi:iron uptake system component EfeO
MVRRAPVLLASCGLAAILAACSSSGVSPTATSGTGGSGNVINVQASEFKFEPAAITAPAGRVTFHVRNAGAAEHEFEILKDGKGIVEIEGLVPGLEKDLTVDLAAGNYSVECHLPGHLEQGMKASLTVTQ